MKNVLPDDKKPILYPYVTSYAVEGDKIIINCSNYPNPIVTDYSIEEEIEVLDKMRKQASDALELEEEYRKELGVHRFHAVAQGFLTAINAALLPLNIGNSIKYINLAAIAVCGTNTVVHSVDASKLKNNLNEINKYKYFLEWEDDINEEIIKRYHELYGEDAPIEEANKMTINDLDKYSLKELMEIIEHIGNEKDRAILSRKNKRI